MDHNTGKLPKCEGLERPPGRFFGMPYLLRLVLQSISIACLFAAIWMNFQFEKDLRSRLAMMDSLSQHRGRGVLQGELDDLIPPDSVNSFFAVSGANTGKDDPEMRKVLTGFVFATDDYRFIASQAGTLLEVESLRPALVPPALSRHLAVVSFVIQAMLLFFGLVHRANSRKVL